MKRNCHYAVIIRFHKNVDDIISLKRDLLEKLVPKRVLIIIKLNFTWKEVYHISISVHSRHPVRTMMYE